MTKLEFAHIRVPEKSTFNDITSEVSRTYRFPNEELVTINHPVAINVARGGGHRVIDEEGKSHYIPKGWIKLTWQAKEGEPHVVF